MKSRTSNGLILTLIPTVFGLEILYDRCQQTLDEYANIAPTDSVYGDWFERMGVAPPPELIMATPQMYAADSTAIAHFLKLVVAVQAFDRYLSFFKTAPRDAARANWHNFHWQMERSLRYAKEAAEKCGQEYLEQEKPR